MLYERSVAELMKEAAAEVPDPCGSGEIILWFQRKYPRVNAGTVRAHIIGLTANHPSRHHYAWLARRSPLFVQVARGQLTRYQPGTEGAENPSLRRRSGPGTVRQGLRGELQPQTSGRSRIGGRVIQRSRRRPISHRPRDDLDRTMSTSGHSLFMGQGWRPERDGLTCQGEPGKSWRRRPFEPGRSEPSRRW